MAEKSRGTKAATRKPPKTSATGKKTNEKASSTVKGKAGTSSRSRAKGKKT